MQASTVSTSHAAKYPADQLSIKKAWRISASCLLFIGLSFMVWQVVQAQTSARKVIVSGLLPDEQTRTAIITKLQEIYGEDRVADRTVIDKLNSPKGWSEQAIKALKPELKAVGAGKLTISHDEVRLSGAVASDEAKKSLDNLMKSAMNSDFHFTNDLAMSSTGQDKIDAILSKQVIEFEMGSAKFTKRGQSVVDEITTLLKSNPKLKRVEIDGHSDNEGARMYNLTLSQTRANSVKYYLIEKGIAENLIVVNGYGPDRPIADNNTQEGRARNRRIEIKIE